MPNRESDTVAYAEHLLSKMGNTALPWISSNIDNIDMEKYISIVVLAKLGVRMSEVEQEYEKECKTES